MPDVQGNSSPQPGWDSLPTTCTAPTAALLAPGAGQEAARWEGCLGGGWGGTTGLPPPLLWHRQRLGRSSIPCMAPRGRQDGISPRISGPAASFSRLEGHVPARGHRASYVPRARRTRPSFPQGAQPRTSGLHTRMITCNIHVHAHAQTGTHSGSYTCTCCGPHSLTPPPARHGAPATFPPTGPSGSLPTPPCTARKLRLGEARPRAPRRQGGAGTSGALSAAGCGAMPACAHASGAAVSTPQSLGGRGQGAGRKRGEAFLRDEEGSRGGAAG